MYTFWNKKVQGEKNYRWFSICVSCSTFSLPFRTKNLPLKIGTYGNLLLNLFSSSCQSSVSSSQIFEKMSFFSKSVKKFWMSSSSSLSGGWKKSMRAFAERSSVLHNQKMVGWQFWGVESFSKSSFLWENFRSVKEVDWVWNLYWINLH